MAAPAALWHIHRMPGKARRTGGRLVFGLLIFAVLATAILLRPAKWLSDFDQSFYLTIAYDVAHHGVFSNGVFDHTAGSVAVPPPGMFFTPVYPLLLVGLAEVDGRFARALDCSVEANEKLRDGGECETYARPAQLLNAALLTLGVIAIALAAELIFASRTVFWLTGILAAVALLPDADLFAFVMTESISFGLYAAAALALLLALEAPRSARLLPAGCLFGLLCLTRPSFLALAPVAAALLLVNDRRLRRAPWRPAGRHLLVFALGWLVVVGPWLVRNAVSVGKWGLSEEYGAATLVERFAYNDMTGRELALAFPYCLPGIGATLVDRAFGPQEMQRFVYYTPRSFFHAGRLHRDKLVEANGRLDPLIGGLIRGEMRQRWWRHLLVSIPLGWCGLWVGGLAGLVLVPLFVCAGIAAVRERRMLFLLYAAPPLAMLVLHALIANEDTRYNLILIGPFAAGAAWMIARLAERRLARSRPAEDGAQAGESRPPPRRAG